MDTGTVNLPDRVTQEVFLSTLAERFGPDPMRWAFECPSCGDVATGQDWKDALTGRDEPASNHLGVHCIGRGLGVLNRDQPKGGYTGRGCDWAAYGWFRGPVLVTDPDGNEMACFRLAPVPSAVQPEQELV